MDDETMRRFFAILSEEEKLRALRFYFDRHCGRYIATHGLLRLILGEYLGIGPKLLTFCTNQHGKPLLCADQNKTNILFNISRSHNVSVIAVSSGPDIGIDIEYIYRDINVLEITQRFFSKGESEKLNALPEYLQKSAFFRCWTRKEAYLKGKGHGLSTDLDRFEVSVLPTQLAAILSSDDSPEDVDSWHLFDIDPYPGFISALAVAGEPLGIQYFTVTSILPKMIEPHGKI